MTYRAVLNGTVLAESDDIVRLEGNVYFPPTAVKWDRLDDSPKTSVCSWKGTANYLDAVVGQDRVPNVGWTYHTPSPKASEITDHVAFWGAVRVERA